MCARAWRFGREAMAECVDAVLASESLIGIAAACAREQEGSLSSRRLDRRARSPPTPFLGCPLPHALLSPSFSHILLSRRPSKTHISSRKRTAQTDKDRARADGPWEARGASPLPPPARVVTRKPPANQPVLTNAPRPRDRPRGRQAPSSRARARARRKEEEQTPRYAPSAAVRPVGAVAVDDARTATAPPPTLAAP